MPDRRFFAYAGPISLAEAVRLTGVSASTPDIDRIEIETVAPLVSADGRSVSFYADRRYASDLAGTKAAAVFVSDKDAARVPDGVVALVGPTPQASWAVIAERLHPARRFEPGPAVHPSAELEEDVEICPGAVVGPGARIGRGTIIGPNAVVGPGVQIGRDCRIGPGVSVCFALVGDRVRLAAGCVIGEPGFGVAGGANGAVDVPQLGRVILQDGVSVGAATCIDRGAYGDTVIGENSKIDNLVQLGHNIRMGRNCLVAGGVGVSGSVVIGDGVIIGGRAGVADHVEIGAGAKIGGAAGVTKDVPPGEIWSGYPARPLRDFLREAAWVAKQAKTRRGAETDD